MKCFAKVPSFRIALVQCPNLDHTYFESATQFQKPSANNFYLHSRYRASAKSKAFRAEPERGSASARTAAVQGGFVSQAERGSTDL
jgi:hypothetical protein